MTTLRKWNGDSNDVILSFLKQYNITDKQISLLKYEALTPDSFIWIINTESGRYCLYAEDYVPSIEHVMMQMEDNRSQWNEHDTYELLPVVKRQDWHTSSPVASASTYEPPEQPEEFMKYAATSGFDFVFLAKVTNQPKTNLD